MDEELYYYDMGYFKNGLQTGFGIRNYNGKVEEGMFDKEIIKTKADDNNKKEDMDKYFDFNKYIFKP
jgi:hypothetical protein